MKRGWGVLLSSSYRLKPRSWHIPWRLWHGRQSAAQCRHPTLQLGDGGEDRSVSTPRGCGGHADLPCDCDLVRCSPTSPNVASIPPAPQPPLPELLATITGPDVPEDGKPIKICPTVVRAQRRVRPPKARLRLAGIPMCGNQSERAQQQADQGARAASTPTVARTYLDRARCARTR